MRFDGTAEVLVDIGPGNYFGEIGPMLNLPAARRPAPGRRRCSRR